MNKRIPRSYEVIGDILIFSDFPKNKKLAEKYLNNHIKVITKKSKNFSGKYRLPKLKILAGEKRKTTIHIENQIKLKVNPEKAYFSSKLSSERLRIAKQVKKTEKVLVMFSGIAPFPITIYKHSKPKEIHAIEINPKAHKLAQENLKLNKIKNIYLYKGNVKKVLPKLKKFDRIVMPAPKNADQFLDLALKHLNKKGIIHLYTFAREEDFKELKNKYKKFKPKLKKCGQTSPRIYRVCLDLKT
jgi:tRNA (guanine37-N1)-methyltransferase